MPSRVGSQLSGARRRLAAGITGQHGPPAEVVFVDLRDHPHHFARGFFPGSLIGKSLPITDAVRGRPAKGSHPTPRAQRRKRPMVSMNSSSGIPLRSWRFLWTWSDISTACPAAGLRVCADWPRPRDAQSRHTHSHQQDAQGSMSRSICEAFAAVGAEQRHAPGFFVFTSRMVLRCLHSYTEELFRA